MQNNKKYHAFISYRHADNKEQGRQWATWLHQAIETYEVPADLVGKKNNLEEEIPARIYPVFRDEEELPADADLANAIVSALDSTRMLIVLCSPQAVASTYVADEIDYFKKQGHSDRIIAAMINGEPNASWDKGKLTSGFNIKDECFPIPLQFEYDKGGNRTSKHAEPIAADFRINNDGKSEQGWASIEAYRQHLKSTTDLDNKQLQKKIDNYQKQQHLMLQKIIAGILGVPLGELTQRDKAHQLELVNQKAKILRRWLTGVFLLALIAIAAGLLAYFKQQEAVKAQKNTQEQLIQANHNYGLALFEKAKQEEKKYNYNKSNFYAANALLKVKDGKYKSKISSLLTSNVNKNNSIWISPINPSDIGQVTSIDYSPDGNTLASGSFDGTIRLWDIVTGKHQAIFTGHKVSNITYSPDGKTIASTSDDKAIYLWDATTGVQIAVFKGHDKEVLSIAFSPDGKLLGSGSYDKSIRIWDVTTGKQKAILKGHDQEVYSVAFSPDGKTLASGSYDLTVRLWDIATKEQLTVLKGHTESVLTVVFSPDGKTLATGSYNTIRIWDLITGKQKIILKGHKQWVTSLDFSSDGKILASGSDDKTIRLWDITTGKHFTILTGHNQEVKSVHFSNDTRTLASGSYDKTIRIWDISRGAFANFNQIPYNISTNSKNLVSAYSPNSDTTIHVWDIISGKLQNLLEGHKDIINYSAFSLDDKTLATSSLDKTMRIWDLTSGKQSGIHFYSGASIAFSPDNKTVAYGLSDLTISIRNIYTGKQQAIFKGRSIIRSIVFSPDGNNIAVNSLGKIIIWDVSSGNKLASHDALSENISNILYSLDGKMIAYISNDENIRLFNVLTGVEQAAFKGHTDKITDFAFSPDGRTLASASLDKSVRLWDLATGEQLAVFEGHNDWVLSIAYSLDGKSILSGSMDKTIHAWNIEQHLDFANNNKYVKQWIDKQLQLFNYQFNGVDLNLVTPEYNVQVTINNPPNWPKTHPIYWLEKAKQGDAEAMLQLGIIYHRSSEDIKAKNWYTKALIAGHKDAQERLDVLSLTTLTTNPVNEHSYDNQLDYLKF